MIAKQKSRLRRAATQLGKVVVTAALLAFVLLRIELDEVAAAVAALSPSAVLLALGLTFAAVAVSAYRWHRILRHLGERVSPWALAGDTLVGGTYNLFLPTSIGGDLARGLRCARRVHDAEHAWASVAFERVLGLLSLTVVSTLGLLGGLAGASRSLLLAAAGMTAILAALLALAPAPLRLAARLAARGSDRLARGLRRIAEAWSGPLGRPVPRLETLAWSLAYQLVALTLLLPVAWHWSVPTLFAAIYLGVPIALVASTLPISLGGHGLRESLFVVVLVPLGLTASQAFTLSLTWLASNLVVASAGLGVLLLTRSEPVTVPD